MKTLKEAIELLISLYKKEIDNSEYYNTQREFVKYVEEFCSVSGINESEINDEQLKECADDFIQNDGGSYLIEDL